MITLLFLSKKTQQITKTLRTKLYSFRQEKLLGELSEKDSQIGDLEMDRSNHGRTDMIEKLNTEKQQIYNQLKELVNSILVLFFSLLQIEKKIYLDRNSNENYSGTFSIETRIRTARKIITNFHCK